MPLTNTESGLISGLVGLIGATTGVWLGGRNKVGRDVCDRRHETESARHEAIIGRLERIEVKLDRMNGGNHQ